MPAALAPEPGAAQLVGEVSGPAEQLGVRPGMRVGEALSRSPELVLVSPDPERAERSWEIVLRRLEGIGAEVESERAGEVFEAAGLRALWGGTARSSPGPGARVGAPARLAAAPGRFCAYAAAREAQDDLSSVVSEGSALAVPGPAAGLASARPARGRRRPPQRARATGYRHARAAGGAPRDAVADRLGNLGLAALRLARGEDEPLRPRRTWEALGVELELPEAASGQQLERALELLIGPARSRGRRGRALRALRLSRASPPGLAA